MLKKYLLTIFLLLPLVAISATALAGSTISDKRYWPSEVRQSTQITTVVLQRDLNSAFAYDWSAPTFPARDYPNETGSAWLRYQGGPKSR